MIDVTLTLERVRAALQVVDGNYAKPVSEMLKTWLQAWSDFGYRFGGTKLMDGTARDVLRMAAYDVDTGLGMMCSQVWAGLCPGGCASCAVRVTLGVDGSRYQSASRDESAGV